MLYNIMRQNKETKERKFWSHNKMEWLPINSEICRNVLTEKDAEFEIMELVNRYGKDFYFLKSLNAVSKRVCKICDISDNTGTNADLETDIHKGFTIGNGKTFYWMMIWHGSGHVTVYNRDSDTIYLKRRWISGDTQITIYFK